MAMSSRGPGRSLSFADYPPINAENRSTKLRTSFQLQPLTKKSVRRGL